MSASPLKADIIGREREVRYGQKRSFDRLVGAGERLHSGNPALPLRAPTSNEHLDAHAQLAVCLKA
jgi:hypothetical protein